MIRSVPDWQIQITWWISGIFATGALWYFLAIKDYSYAAGSGLVALLFAIIAVALHKKKDKIAEQAVPDEFKDSLPENYIRRSLDDASDIRLFESLPEVKALAYSMAQAGWDTGTTIEMRQASHDVVDFYEFIWLRLAEFYPHKTFGKNGALEYIQEFIRERYKFHWSKHEPNGAGTGGTIVGVLTGGDVLNDLDGLMVQTATAIVGYREDFDFDSWLKKWKDTKSSSS
jgi:hypothetical protein